jgi:hypothetical protein
MIGETGSAERGATRPAGSRIAGNAAARGLPEIEAIVWFNWNIEENGGRREWQIESSPSAQPAFVKGISSPYYAGNRFGELPPLTRIQPLP